MVAHWFNFSTSKQVSELHAQLAVAKAEVHKMELQQANLLALIRKERSQFEGEDQDYSILTQLHHFPFPDFTLDFPHNYKSPQIVWDSSWSS